MRSRRLHDRHARWNAGAAGRRLRGRFHTRGRQRLHRAAETEPARRLGVDDAGDDHVVRRPGLRHGHAGQGLHRDRDDRLRPAGRFLHAAGLELSVAGLARAKHPAPVQAGLHRLSKPSYGAETVEQILERIRATRNFDFRHYKRPTLHRRIERRMAERKCKTAAEYLALLDRDPGECDALIASMLIKVTGFFRDAETWTLLSGKVIPQLLAEKRPGEAIRVWFAGAANVDV